jgi:hypothetical protein
MLSVSYAQSHLRCVSHTSYLYCRRDIQYNDIQNNDTQQNSK